MGPLQLYVPPGAVAFRLSVDPAQSVAVPLTPGGAGVAFTVTPIVPVGPLHPAEETTSEYTPAIDVEVIVTTGFCAVELYPEGPVHA